MSPVMDALIDDIRTWPLPIGLLIYCGQKCGHRRVLRAGATVGQQIAAGRHECPRAPRVLAHVLARRAGSCCAEFARTGYAHTEACCYLGEEV